MSERLDRSTVGEIVATDYRAARVFEQFGIDFCCGGRRSLAEACASASIDPVVLERALDALPTAAESGDGDVDDVTRWAPDRILEHVVETHHAYVRQALPAIAGYLTKLVDVHGARHPELTRIASTFAHLGQDLLQHMMKEERILFPYIRELASHPRRHAPSPFGTVANPIRMMEREHREVGDEMRLIREVTNGYLPPADACATYRVCFGELATFERDLHRHVHLENNVLFPKAVELERETWRA